MNERTVPDSMGAAGVAGTAGAPAEEFLLQAIDLAEQSRKAGDPPFGSVLVDATGAIIRRARNTVTSERDITAHPELTLARWAASTFTQQQCRTLTLYTSCQPCPMCTNVIARAALGQVVYALSTTQLQVLKPEGHVDPDSAVVDYDGPLLYSAAIVPLVGYYRAK
jgi:tRNA(Arg) A34 adenosine deaminase TadA